MTPREYAEKYNLRPVQVAYEHCITEVGYRKQCLATKNKTKPSAQTCRISQLLDYIKDLGHEPPQPIFFD